MQIEWKLNDPQMWGSGSGAVWWGGVGGYQNWVIVSQLPGVFELWKNMVSFCSCGKMLLTLCLALMGLRLACHSAIVHEYSRYD